MNKTFMWLIIYICVSLIQCAEQNETQSLIIPKELGNYFEENDYSNSSCIYLQYLNLTMFTLNNFSINFINNDFTLHFCPNINNNNNNNVNTSTYITNTNNTIYSPISTYIKHNEVYVKVLNTSILNANQTDTYILRCSIDSDSNTNPTTNIINIPNTHCFIYKIQNFLYENNPIFSNLLILFGVIILFFGNAYPRSAIIITCIYILFYSVQLLFDLMQFNILGKRNVNTFYWGLLLIVLILGPLLGVLITLSSTIFRFAMGFFGGYLGFKMLLYYPLLLKFSNPVTINQYVGVAFHGGVGVALGIAFIFIKQTKLCMRIATSIVGSYMFVVGLGLYAGGFLNEMYAASLARCGDYVSVRKYLNRGITWFYIGWFVLLGVCGVLFQNWRDKMQQQEEKPFKQQHKQEIDLTAKSYQLMDKSSMIVSDDEDDDN